MTGYEKQEDSQPKQEDMNWLDIFVDNAYPTNTLVPSDVIVINA